MELLTAFIQHWQQQRLVAPGQVILLATSGGSDSMTMAHLFLEAGLPFALGHCNFQLRGEDADGDEQFVRDWAKLRNVPFHSVRFNTKEKSAEWKKGTQETARILRYEWLEQVREHHHYAAIATAHHANDNVETLLINLFKGTGISGLHGIRLQNGNIIRPLLFAPKQAITEYIQQHDIQYREDASNASDAYLRNAVRHHIVPAVEQWFPNAIEHVNDSIARFSQAEQLYNNAIAQERKKLIEQRRQDYYIPIRKLQHRQPLETICYELLKPFGYTAARVPQILQLLSAESGKLVLSGTHRIIRNRDFLIVTAIPPDATDFISIEGVPANIDTGRLHFSFAIENTPPTLPTDSHIACINLERVEFPLILRKWRTGDYFYPLGMQMKKKKLSKFFVDQKVPLHEKEHIWVLESGKRIIWIAGMRLDERFKVKDNTQEVLRIEITKPKS